MAGVLSFGALAAPASAGEVERIGGSDRIATAIQVFENNRSVFTSDTVILVRSDEYADALTATPLATALKAPVLTTPAGGIDARVMASLKAQGIKNVIIVGGENAVTPDAVKALGDAGLATERLAGTTRYDTALKVAAKVMDVRGVDSVPVFLATGTNFADAMAAGAAAAAKGAVVLLSQGDRIDPATAEFIRSDKASSTLAVGGPAGRAMNSVGVAGDIIAGVDRFDTAAKLAKAVFPDPKNVLLTSGITYADSLAGAALAALTGAPMLLTAPGAIPAQTQAYLTATKPNVSVIGGPNVIPDDQVKGVQGVVTVPPPATTPQPPTSVTPVPPSGTGNPAPQPPVVTPPTPPEGSGQTPPSTLTFTKDLPSQVLVAEGDGYSASWQTNWRTGDVKFQYWIKYPGAAEFSSQGSELMSGLGGVSWPSSTLSDSGTVIKVLAVWNGKKYWSNEMKVIVVTGGRAVTPIISDIGDVSGDSQRIEVPISISVSGIESSSEGNVSVRASLGDITHVGGNFSDSFLNPGSGSTYSGRVAVPFPGNWKFRAAFHPKDPSNHSFGQSEQVEGAVRELANPRLTGVVVSAFVDEPLGLVSGKMAKLTADVKRDNESVAEGRVNFFVNEYAVGTDWNGSDGWSVDWPIHPFEPGELRTQYVGAASSKDMPARTSSPLALKIHPFSIVLDPGGGLDAVPVRSDTVALKSGGRSVKVVSPEGVAFSDVRVSDARLLTGQEGAGVRPVLSVDDQGRVTVSVPEGASPGDWRFMLNAVTGLGVYSESLAVDITVID